MSQKCPWLKFAQICLKAKSPTNSCLNWLMNFQESNTIWLDSGRGHIYIKSKQFTLWTVNRYRIDYYFQPSIITFPGPKFRGGSLYLNWNWSHECLLVSWWSEVTPSATPFFKRAYKMLCLALPAWRNVRKLDFQSEFSTSKIIRIFLNFFFIEE